MAAVSLRKAMEKKQIANTPAPHDLTRILKRFASAFGVDVADEAIENFAKEAAPELAPRIIPDRRYKIAELEWWFGLKRGRLYKAHKEVIRNEGRSAFVLGRDVLTLNETAPKLVGKAPTSTALLPRRRGRPRKDAKRSTDESTDSLTIRNVVVKDNRVVHVHGWTHQMEDCSGSLRKAA
jgi:hypothetical protein